MVKELFRRISILILAVSILTFVGCKKSNIDLEDQTGLSSKATIYYSTNEKGEKTYYQEQYPEVVQIRNLVKDYCKAIDERSYKTVTGVEEYTFYTNELQDYLIKQKDVQETKKVYTENSLEKKHLSVEINELKFDSTLEKVNVKLVSKFEVLGASKEYLQSKNLALNVPCSQKRELLFVKKDGMWKIEEVSLGKSQQVKE